jgi:hypothetical protein
MVVENVSSRLVKELRHYEAELAANEAKVADLKIKAAAAGQDDDDDTHLYDIKYQQNIMNESRVMVPDAHRRLALALEELAEQLALVGGGDDLESSTTDDNVDVAEWKATAQQLLQEHAATFRRHDVLLTDVEGLADGEAF